MKLTAETTKEEVFSEIRAYLQKQGFSIADFDDQRPWGGFFVIDEKQAPKFIETYFSHLSIDDFSGFSKLSPKILLVAPGKRLSWQYHHRRAEIWKVIGGSAGIVISDTDELTSVKKLAVNDVVNLKKGQRHRLVGIDEWGVISEIWQHTDPENPSDEDDIVRVEDDFGR